MGGTVHIDRDGSVALLILDNPPVNAISSDVRSDLFAALGEIEGNKEIEAVVLIGAGKTFVAGSDISEFDLPLAYPQLPAILSKIESSRLPFVAALQGAAFGGGYELALACDARIALSGALVGLPETTLGVIPGAGGTQKLPRIVGASKAIELICTGKRLPVEQALALGMVDKVVESDLRVAARQLAVALVGTKRRVIDRSVPDKAVESVEAAARKALGSGRHRPHIAAAIDCIRLAGHVSAQEGLNRERAVFERLRTGDEARALRHIFFAERDAGRGREGRQAKARPFSSFGVVGAGTMGAGIAANILQAGYSVTLIDSDEGAIARARTLIGTVLDRAQSAGRLSSGAADAAKSNLATGYDLSKLDTCDVLIEAIIEDLGAKTALFRELDVVANKQALLATNTSYLDIDAIADATSRPENVVGLHFFAPAYAMKLLEVVGGKFSSDEAMATGLAVAKRLGKQAVEAGNGFGFIGNRIYSAYRASCEIMLEDGALPHEVDAALEAFGFAMGPFAVADLSGLDIAWRMRQQNGGAQAASGRYVHIPDRLCEAGRLGRKTGLGYYRYGDGGQPERDPEVENLIMKASMEKGVERKQIDPETIQLRALAAIVNEAGLVLEEGIALRPGDIDVVLVNGYGFPRWTGGPLHWASRQDAVRFSHACASFVADAGPNKRLADLRKFGIGNPDN
ncbi:3-hydroxyacyl-CoA dehydrogenase NAD-binding domain-containing protein [Pelagibacterium limicola]|uniref:3-hydroxyacyl-CoA dehydrogenase NAD-binding domain-containing protein n=1 Tax=Pelagibacterium limicola TaxID=2791022 RepID=UPI0018AF932B|nr:3-hydroxyacyl-CoA dehydrogenase NAD-binding domain-containing protein [Pelagibacterium limicola]